MTSKFIYTLLKILQKTIHLLEKSLKPGLKFMDKKNKMDKNCLLDCCYCGLYCCFSGTHPFKNGCWFLCLSHGAYFWCSFFLGRIVAFCRQETYWKTLDSNSNNIGCCFARYRCSACRINAVDPIDQNSSYFHCNFYYILDIDLQLYEGPRSSISPIIFCGY